MQLPSFKYVRPASMEALRAALAEPGCALLAGGQSLLPALGDPAGPRPRTLVDIGGLAQLQGCTRGPVCLVIGAATSLSDCERQGVALGASALLLAAVGRTANPVIRNRATIGGHVVVGDARSALCASLVALDATLGIMGMRDSRSVSVEGFLTRPAGERLAPAEVITTITVPLPGEGSRTALTHLGERAQGYSTVGFAALRAAGESSRLVLFGLAGAPFLLRDTGTSLDRANWTASGAGPLRTELAARGGDALDPCRVHLARRLLERLCDGEGWL